MEESLNILLRFFHLIAVISWIGSSFYFMWLDKNLDKSPGQKKDVEGHLWMVHSGGFYQVEKTFIRSENMPKKLHWFKWEAFFAGVTGFALLILVYYLHADVMLVHPTRKILSVDQTVAGTLALIVLSWILYDWLWNRKLFKSSFISLACAFFLLSSLAYTYYYFLAPRAAFLHFGGTLGILMVLNVWVRIIPFQKKMVEATRLGLQPDYGLGLQAKRRSVHNSYLTLPVLLMMLSQHSSSFYSHRYSWVVLIGLVVLGILIRHSTIVGRNAYLVPAGILACALYFFSAGSTQEIRADHNENFVSDNTLRAIVDHRCMACHSATPKDARFGASPGGVDFGKPESIGTHAARIYERVVVQKTMPLLNETNISEEERGLIKKWFEERHSE